MRPIAGNHSHRLGFTGNAHYARCAAFGGHPLGCLRLPNTLKGGHQTGLERQNENCCGFTLVELMVVIVLIGIMTAMIIPEMKGTFEDALLRSTSRELVNVFGVACSHAVSVNQVLQVRLDSKSGHYAIEKRVREGGRGHQFVPARDVPGAEGKLDTRISIEVRRPGEEAAGAPAEEALPAAESNPQAPESGDTIAFYPDGTADAREIVLRDRDGFRLALRVNPVTARVHIVELARE